MSCSISLAGKSCCCSSKKVDQDEDGEDSSKQNHCDIRDTSIKDAHIWGAVWDIIKNLTYTHTTEMVSQTQLRLLLLLVIPGMKAQPLRTLRSQRHLCLTTWPMQDVWGLFGQPETGICWYKTLSCFRSSTGFKVHFRGI